MNESGKNECDICSHKGTERTIENSGNDKNIIANVDLKPVICNQCCFENNDDLENHSLAIKTEEVIIKEEIKEEATVEEVSADIHVVTEMAYFMYCYDCGYSTDDKFNLIKHVQSHKTVKFHNCDKCDFRTLYPASLTRHMKIHTHEKPYACHKCTHTESQTSKNTSQKNNSSSTFIAPPNATSANPQRRIITLNKKYTHDDDEHRFNSRQNGMRAVAGQKRSYDEAIHENGDMNGSSKKNRVQSFQPVSTQTVLSNLNENLLREGSPQSANENEDLMYEIIDDYEETQQQRHLPPDVESGSGARFQVDPETTTTLLSSLLTCMQSVEKKVGNVESSIKVLNAKMNNMDSKLSLLEMQIKKIGTPNAMPTKPTIFPMTTVEEFDAFEQLTTEDYDTVVSYLAFLGGNDLKESLNLMTKECISNELAQKVTLTGKEKTKSIQDSKLFKAYYDAACANKHFGKPQLQKFKVAISDALKAAKQRFRNKHRDGFEITATSACKKSAH